MNEKMTAKEFLNRARKIDLEIKSKYEVLEKLYPPQISKYSIGTKSTTNENTNEEIFIKHSEIERELTIKFKELFEIKEIIVDLCDKMRGTDYIILIEQRYILCKSWCEIAEFLGYTEEYTRGELHGKALVEATKYKYLWQR